MSTQHAVKRGSFQTIEGLVWCVAHAAVHPDLQQSLDPPVAGFRACDEADWRTLYYRARKDD